MGRGAGVKARAAVGAEGVRKQLGARDRQLGARELQLGARGPHLGVLEALLVERYEVALGRVHAILPLPFELRPLALALLEPMRLPDKGETRLLPPPGLACEREWSGVKGMV